MGLIRKIFHLGFDDKLLSSRYPLALKLIRIISSLFFTAAMIYYIVTFSISVLKFFTFEVFLLTTICFDLTALSYLCKQLRPLAYVFNELIFPFNCIVTIIYWAYLSPYSYSESQIMGFIVPHTIPVLMNFIDYSLNEIQFYRKHYLVPFAYMIIYGFGVLLPITLIEGELYIFQFHYY